MLDIQPNDNLFEGLRRKAGFKQMIYHSTVECFKLFKKCLSQLVDDYHKVYGAEKPVLAFEFHDRGDFEAELKFGSDVLIFVMHTNVFEFPRDHQVMKTYYVQEDETRSYTGMIMVFNFLADSIKYNRTNDLGYMIGRLFLNKDKHYFVEGKREVGQLYSNFESSVLDEKAVMEICNSAIRYAVNFDLLTPPYDLVKSITVGDIQSALENLKMTTGKRLGFRFQGDHEEIT